MIERYTSAEIRRIWSEESRLDKWLQVEVAVCEGWAEEGLIPKEALERICSATYNKERIAEAFARTRHDMTAFLRSVTESLGDEGAFVHFGLTSSDIIDTALSLQLLEALAVIETDLEAAIEAVRRRALEHRRTLVVGRTHGIHAEPTTFGLKLAVWWEELKRHRQRLRDAREQISFGKISGAVGTHATVPASVEAYVCAKLGLRPAPISTQILQRDRHAHLVTTLALLGSSLERFATEIRGLQRTEVHEVEEPFGEEQTGSSAMPHKRNPELSERICGLARLLRGFAVTAMENVALWHERDISHSSAERLILPDSTSLSDYMLRTFTFIVAGMRVFPERMRRNLEMTRGLIFSQPVLLALIRRGMSRQEAYRIVQECSARAAEQEADFATMLKAEPRISSLLSEDELDALFRYDCYLSAADEAFERLGLVEKAAAEKLVEGA